MVTLQESKDSGLLAVTQSREIVVRMKNDIGILFELSTHLAHQGINILALNGAVCNEDCVIRLVTDDSQKTKELLAEHNFAPEEESVVLAEIHHRPGMLKQVTKTLAQAGLDIRHIYAAATQQQDRCLLVLHCARDEEALARLKSMA